MLKKCLSIIVSILLIITSITGISLVTTYATGDIATPDIVTTTINTVPSTTLRNINRHELERYVYSCTFPPGNIYDKTELNKAIAFANEVLANPNATQDELNFAYYNILEAVQTIEIIGIGGAPLLSGDYIQDKEVNIKDVTAVHMVVAKFSNFKQDKNNDYCYADVNFDFKINIKDVTMIQCFVAGYTDEASCGYTGQRCSFSYYYNNQYEIG